MKQSESGSETYNKLKILSPAHETIKHTLNLNTKSSDRN